MKGVFISFEGAEGSGKSTQIQLLQDFFKKINQDIVLLREPGGVVISEKIRNVLLDVENAAMCDACETLLYMASRAQMVQELLRPALEAGKVVLCDRFLDSTVAYQGYGRDVDVDIIQKVGMFATQGVIPNLTIYLDIEPHVGFERIKKREKDRIELRSLDYHERVRQGYLALACKEPSRIQVLDASLDINQITEKIQTIVCETFPVFQRC